MDIEEIVQKIFTVPPRQPNTIIMDLNYCCEEDINISNNEYVFSFLINLYVTAMVTFCEEKSVEKKIDVNSINISTLLMLEKWFQSFGFNINVHEYSDEDFKSLQPSLNLYCRIMLRDNPNDKIVFYFGITDKPFTLINYSTFKNDGNFNGMCCSIRIKKTYYIISFSRLN